jgi:acetyl esterase/lipase
MSLILRTNAMALATILVTALVSSLMIGATGGPGDSSAADPVDRASSRVQAVACFCPPTDFVNYGAAGRSFLEYETVRYVWHVFGVDELPWQVQLETLRKLSPLTVVTRDMPPTLIIHGTEDPKVPYEQSVRLTARLKELGVPHQLVTRDGAGHGWPTMNDDHAILADWFDKHLVTPQAKK